MSKPHHNVGLVLCTNSLSPFSKGLALALAHEAQVRGISVVILEEREPVQELRVSDLDLKVLSPIKLKKPTDWKGFSDEKKPFANPPKKISPTRARQ